MIWSWLSRFAFNLFVLHDPLTDQQCNCSCSTFTSAGRRSVSSALGNKFTKNKGLMVLYAFRLGKGILFGIWILCICSSRAIQGQFNYSALFSFFSLSFFLVFYKQLALPFPLPLPLPLPPAPWTPLLRLSLAASSRQQAVAAVGIREMRTERAIERGRERKSSATRKSFSISSTLGCCKVRWRSNGTLS